MNIINILESFNKPFGMRAKKYKLLKMLYLKKYR